MRQVFSTAITQTKIYTLDFQIRTLQNAAASLKLPRRVPYTGISITNANGKRISQP